MSKRPKKFPPIKEYLAKNPTKSLFDYTEEYGLEAWNAEISPMISQSLRDEIWPKGAALVGMEKNSDRIIWHYRNDRIESESINEIFVIGKKNDKLITDVMQLIFTIGDKVFINGQYGKLKEIHEGAINNLYKTRIGHVYSLVVDGIDLDKFENVCL